jgi:hypothetical protein
MPRSTGHLYVSHMNPFPYKDVFLAVEKRLIEAGSTQMDMAKIQGHLDTFKRFENRELTDDQYFSILVFVAFYSGFKAATVTSKRAVIQKNFPSWAVASAYAEKDMRFPRYFVCQGVGFMLPVFPAVAH